MKLTVKDLSFKYDDKVILDKLNLNIKTNEFISIVGPSGCGKSTILKLLANVLKIQTGEIYLNEKKIDNKIFNFAYMPQDDLLLPWFTIYENICLYDKIHKINTNKSEVLNDFKKFGIDGYENRYPTSLSGGMRQRAAFLRTIRSNADVILLDEPFRALDVITKDSMHNWLNVLKQEYKRTIILVTHDIDEAIYLSDRIIVMNKTNKNIVEEINVIENNRTKKWVYKQFELRDKINKLMG